MNSHRTLWSMLLVILLAFCCCAATAAVAGFAINRSFDWKSLRWSGLEAMPAGAEVTEHLERSASVTAPVNLFVDVPVGNITVRASAVDQVVLQATKRAWGWNRSQAETMLHNIAVSFEQSGDQIRVKAAGLTTVQNVPRSPQVDITISVPEETAMKLVSNVGRILVAGTHGNAYVKADVGQVVLQDVAPTGSLQVETRVATIDLVGLLTDNTTYRLTSDVGRIALRLPPDSSFSIDARSDIGIVRVEFPVAGRSSRQGFVGEEVRGDVGTNPTAELYLRSRVGDVSVQPLTKRSRPGHFPQDDNIQLFQVGPLAHVIVQIVQEEGQCHAGSQG
jgi:ToastRack found in some PspC